nr:hypothetical protein [Tanacetum cinerariifolium]
MLHKHLVNLFEYGNILRNKSSITCSFFIIAVQTLGSGISIPLAVGTPSAGSGKLYCQWELCPSSGNALCILFPTNWAIGRPKAMMSPMLAHLGWPKYRQHGRMILELVENGPLLWPTVEVNRVTRSKKYSELSAPEAIQADCDVKATNIILQGLLPEVYALVSTHKVAKEL